MIANPITVKGGEAYKHASLNGDDFVISTGASGLSEIHLKISGVKRLIAIQATVMESGYAVHWGFWAVSLEDESNLTVACVRTPTSTAGFFGDYPTITDTEVFFTARTVPAQTISDSVAFKVANVIYQ